MLTWPPRNQDRLAWVSYLYSHHQFMVYNVVRIVAHAVQRTGGVEVAGHSSTNIHILPNPLYKNHNITKSLHMFKIMIQFH